MDDPLDLLPGESEPEEGPDEPVEQQPAGKKKMPGWKKALLVLGVLLLVLAGGAVGGGYYLIHRYDHKVTRADLLPSDGSAAAPQQVKQDIKAGPLNFLLLGSDSRATTPGGVSPIGERSDTIMLIHVSQDHTHATIVSIPRDSYVNVPAAGSWKGGKNKINAAFAYGGAKLTATTVHQLTGVTLDGAMIANFASIHELVDAVDGVSVCLPYDVHSTFSPTVWRKGCHTMNGDQAEEFMRQREEVPGGDFGRMYDQQLVVKSVISKVSAGGLLTNPLKFDELMSTVADALTVDNSLNIVDLALALRDIRPANIAYATAPATSSSLRTPYGVAVQLDETLAPQMFAAIKNDTITPWLAAHPQHAPDA